jgi:hypothetical protein
MTRQGARQRGFSVSGAEGGGQRSYRRFAPRVRELDCFAASLRKLLEAAEKSLDEVVRLVVMRIKGARMVVESMNGSSRSASASSVPAARSQTPYGSQRAKRAHAECHLPNLPGKSHPGASRPGDIERRLDKQPVVRCPASFVSIGLPGGWASIRNHRSSINIRRSMSLLQKAGYRTQNLYCKQPPGSSGSGWPNAR